MKFLSFTITLVVLAFAAGANLRSNRLLSNAKKRLFDGVDDIISDDYAAEEGLTDDYEDVTSLPKPVPKPKPVPFPRPLPPVDNDPTDKDYSKITPTDLSVSGQRFGSTLAVDAGLLAVGAVAVNRVYLYSMTMTEDQAGSLQWSPVATLQSSMTSSSDTDSSAGSLSGFGHSLALSSLSLAVGAPYESSSSSTTSSDSTAHYLAGRVYIFNRDDASLMQVLSSPSSGGYSTGGALFGSSLALSTTTASSSATVSENMSAASSNNIIEWLAIGSPGDSTHGAMLQGAVYLYTRSSTQSQSASMWTLYATLGSEQVAYDRFGSSLAFLPTTSTSTTTTTTVVTRSDTDTRNSQNLGNFTQNTQNLGNYTVNSNHTQDTEENVSVATVVQKVGLAIGSTGYSGHGIVNAGAVYIYSADITTTFSSASNTTVEFGEVVSAMAMYSNDDNSKYFGRALSISSNGTMTISALFSTDDKQEGVVHIYRYDHAQQVFDYSDSVTSPYPASAMWGMTMATYQDTLLLVSGPSSSDSDIEGVSVFYSTTLCTTASNNKEIWEFAGLISPNQTQIAQGNLTQNAQNLGYGRSLGILGSSGSVLVGAPLDDEYTGSVYVHDSVLSAYLGLGSTPCALNPDSGYYPDTPTYPGSESKSGSGEGEWLDENKTLFLSLAFVPLMLCAAALIYHFKLGGLGLKKAAAGGGSSGAGGDGGGHTFLSLLHGMKGFQAVSLSAINKPTVTTDAAGGNVVEEGKEVALSSPVGMWTENPLAATTITATTSTTTAAVSGKTTVSAVNRFFTARSPRTTTQVTVATVPSIATRHSLQIQTTGAEENQEAEDAANGAVGTGASSTVTRMWRRLIKVYDPIAPSAAAADDQEEEAEGEGNGEKVKGSEGQVQLVKNGFEEAVLQV